MTHSSESHHIILTRAAVARDVTLIRRTALEQDVTL